MTNLEKLNKIKNLLDIFSDIKELTEYMEVLIEIEKEYQEDSENYIKIHKSFTNE